MSYNEKSDVWALGIIFHQLFTNGSHPFTGGNTKEETKAKILDPNIQIHQKIKENPRFMKIIISNSMIF